MRQRKVINDISALLRTECLIGIGSALMSFALFSYPSRGAFQKLYGDLASPTIGMFFLAGAILAFRAMSEQNVESRAFKLAIASLPFAVYAAVTAYFSFRLLADNNPGGTLTAPVMYAGVYVLISKLVLQELER